MDLINQLGELALGSRLKRLSDWIMQDGTKIYQRMQIDFEPKWFPLFYLLKDHSRLGITDCSQRLSVTHSAVNQIAAEMISKGLLKSEKDKTDGRRRLLSLTDTGRKLVPQMEHAWEIIRGSMHDLLLEIDEDVLSVLQKLEDRLGNQQFYEKCVSEYKRQQYEAIEILDYQPRYKKYFDLLNREWLEKYFTVEEIDESYFADPVRKVIKKGGYICFARYRGQIVGTCALIKHSSYFELAKMGVTESAQGNQIGKKLAIHIIEKARAMDLKEIHLETNSKLLPAINLYRRVGFKMDDPAKYGKSDYARSNVHMVLSLQ